MSVSQFGNTIRLPSPISIAYWNSRQNYPTYYQRLIELHGNNNQILDALRARVLDKFQEFVHSIKERLAMDLKYKRFGHPFARRLQHIEPDIDENENLTEELAERQFFVRPT